MRQNNLIRRTLGKISEGDIVLITVDKNTNKRKPEKDEEEIRLKATEVPRNPTKSITVFWNPEADLENSNAKELIDAGHKTVNLQKSRENSASKQKGYRYEIRDTMNGDLDCLGVVNLEIEGWLLDLFPTLKL